MKNILLITAIDPDNKAPYKTYCFASWRHWCKRNNVELVVVEDSNLIQGDVPPHWYRYLAFDVLDKLGIESSNVALIDMDTTVHPDCPNFFEICENKLGCVLDIDNPMWNLLSVKHYEPFFPGISIDWGDYFNTGVIVANNSHKEFFDLNIEFYRKNKKNFLNRNILDKALGSDQTPFNYLLRQQKIDVCTLPKKFNISQPHLKAVLSEDYYPEIVGIWHYNAMNDDDRSTVMEKFCKLNEIEI